MGEFLSGQGACAVTQVATVFGGSNPLLTHKNKKN
jgi:hypothetical protein